MKKQMPVRFFFVPLVVLAVLISIGCSATPVARIPGATYELTVLHTNDHHGTVLSKNGEAGLAERAAFVKSVRDSCGNVLVLDAGDINTGSALSNMFAAEPDIMAYNLIGYDAVTFGNHEFDKSLSVLQGQMQQSRFSWLSANIKKSDGSWLGSPYLIKDFEGFRVGVIGLTTVRTTTIASPDKNLVFTDEIKAAAEMVKKLRDKEKCDVVIVLSHLGSVKEAEGQNTSVLLAERVPGIDLIIDGHSHTYFSEPAIINGTPIVSANEWGKVMGEGHFSITDGAVTAFDWNPVKITSAIFPPDEEMTALLEPYVKAAEEGLKEVVMCTGAEFEFGDRLSRYKEIALGDLVSDAQVWYVRRSGIDVDFGFCNGGNIRAPLPAGEVTKENLMTVLPFDNYLYVLSLKGSDVIELFNFIGTIKRGSGAFPQVSREVRYTLFYNDDGSSGISGVTVNGLPVDPERTYRLVTNDYLAGGGDGYEVLTRSVETFNTSMLLCDVVVEYVKTLPQPVMPETDGRITITGNISP